MDNPTDSIFEESREELIEDFIPVGYETRKVYLRRIGNSALTKQAILTTIDDGVVILEYSGHGGTQTWADEGIFRIENAETLRNERLPFIITTTCLNGQFDQPLQFGQRSMSEQFLMGRYGAIGTLSATRLTFGSANAEFDKDLFNSIFTVQPSTLGAIIADAKTQFMMRAPALWIPGAEQYTLFGDPATRLALPDLEIRVELDELAVDPNKELVIRQNVVGRHQFSPITGAIEFRQATDFSTGAMSALALFANDLDDNPTNDRPTRKDRIQVWQGGFGTIRMAIPQDVEPGPGIVRLFAFDDQRAAVGGTKFWTYQPAILEVREDMDHRVANTLNLSVLVVDNEGPDGLKSVEVIWSDTVEFAEHTVSMSPDPAPPSPAVRGGRWYTLRTPIPLPKGGKSVRYQIVVTDRTDHVVKTDRKSLRVPEGANIAIASATPIRYSFLKARNAYTLTVDLVNDGGKEIDVDIEVWFSADDPDRNRDSQIDADAAVFGRVRVGADEWKAGATNLQEVTVMLILDEPLSTGFHQIHVFADPESPDDDPTDRIIGKLDEPRQFDNRAVQSLVVNQFTLKVGETLTAFSLNRVFDAFFPIGAAGEGTVTLGIDAIEPPVSFQPGLRLMTHQTEAFRKAYRIELHTDVKQLAKPAVLKFRFDLDAVKGHLQKDFGLTPGTEEFNTALQREVERLAIYAWQTEIRAWKRLPSEVSRDREGNFVPDRFVTPAQPENKSAQTLRTSSVRVDSTLTPAGRWAIVFLDADRYEILLQRQGRSEVEKLNRSGQVDNIFRDEVLGIEFDIPRPEADASGENLPFAFGDVLAFDTAASPTGTVRLSALRNTNRGDGSAQVRVNAGVENQFETGDWLIFFRDSEQFEVRNALNEPILNARGNPAVGRINQPLVIDHLGIEIQVASGDDPFAFGDKLKFSALTVGVVSTETRELSTVALMMNSDVAPPKLQFWVNGEVPPNGSVIPPRPDISLLLEDENGIDLESFVLSVSKDDGPFEAIQDFNIVSRQPVTTVPIRYKPILFIGRYLFRVGVSDLNGNALGGESGFREFLFLVEQQPDLEPPTVEIRLNGGVLTDGEIIREQPQFDIEIADEHGIHPQTIQFAFGSTSTPLLPLPEENYALAFDVTQPTQAQITFEPDLPNDEYQIQVLVTDTSENTTETPIYRFRLEEPVEITSILNAPNPIRTNTVFTYNLVQVPDRVTIKIYTVNGRLIRTLEDASARRHYNETYWDARDENGTRLANGTYFYKVTVETDEDKIEEVGRLAILR
ncbi:MAG: C25 family cysteine peptidase [Candidatus Poribacteria bacterium]|nr:C25 family cysteine peptidase [Candidatus Poribacteria bacterium]